MNVLILIAIGLAVLLIALSILVGMLHVFNKLLFCLSDKFGWYGWQGAIYTGLIFLALLVIIPTLGMIAFKVFLWAWA